MSIDLDLAARVMATIAKSGLAPAGALELHSTLRGDLGLCSGDNQVLASFCETEFGVDVAVIEAALWQTVADVVRSVQRKRGADHG